MNNDEALGARASWAELTEVDVSATQLRCRNLLPGNTESKFRGRIQSKRPGD